VKLEQERGTEPSTIRTNVDLCRHVENTLGFVLDPSKPPWKARQIEAGKLKRKRATDPELYSVENLLLTVEYLRQRRQEVKSPAAVCWFVQEALERALKEPTVDELASLIQAAIDQEQSRPGGAEWIGRLTRARGDARAEVYREWEAARGR
jgi:hypothetical protein